MTSDPVLETARTLMGDAFVEAVVCVQRDLFPGASVREVMELMAAYRAAGGRR